MIERFHFVIDGQLHGLNEHLKAVNNSRYDGADVKKTEQLHIEFIIKAALAHSDLELPFSVPVQVCFDWYEPDKRRDPDNVCFAHKYILDALVAQHVIRSDGWKALSMPEPFKDCFFVDKENPRVEVTIIAVADEPVDIETQRRKPIRRSLALAC